MSNGPHLYGTGILYGTDHYYGELAEIFSDSEVATTPIYSAAGMYGAGIYGAGTYGSGGGGKLSPVYTAEAPTTPTYTPE